MKYDMGISNPSGDIFVGYRIQQVFDIDASFKSCVSNSTSVSLIGINNTINLTSYTVEYMCGIEDESNHFVQSNKFCLIWKKIVNCKL